MGTAHVTFPLLCLTAAVCSAAAAAAVLRTPSAALRVPADQMSTSTETSAVSAAAVPASTEAEERSVLGAGSGGAHHPRHRVHAMQSSHAVQWVGMGTPPPRWHVPPPPVTPGWRFEPGVSSGSGFWPDIVHAMGGKAHQKTASDPVAAEVATATARADTTDHTTPQARSRATTGATSSKISHLNALTSGTYQTAAAPAAAPGTQLARPAAARAITATATATAKTATAGPVATRRGQDSGGWLKIYSMQPQSYTDSGTDAAIKRQDSEVPATDQERRPPGPPTQQYRAEYVSELPADGVLIAGLPQRETPTAPQQTRPSRRPPPPPPHHQNRGFMDNMLRLFGGSSPRPQRQRPSFHRPAAPHHQRPAQQQQFQLHHNQQQQQQQQPDNFQQQPDNVQQQSDFQQQNDVQQQQQQQPLKLQNGFQQQEQLQNGFQQQQFVAQQQQELAYEQLQQVDQLTQQQQQQQQQQQFGLPEFAGEPFSQADRFSPSVQDHAAPAGAGPSASHFRPLRVSQTQRPRRQQQQRVPESQTGFSVSSQFPASPAATRPIPSWPTKSRPGVPLLYLPTSAPASSSAVGAAEFEPARLPSVSQSLDEGPAGRTAALTAAYLRSPQTTTRRDDGTMVVTGALVDDAASDDVVELVIEYDNDLESIVDELLREVRGGRGGGERAAAEREPAPAASQLRRRPFTVQQLDQRLGLAHQPYYHIAMALHSLTQGDGVRKR